MDKKNAGLIGMIAGLAAAGPAQAAMPPAHAPAEIMQVSSYADLLKPIPNAAAILQQSYAEHPKIVAAQYDNGGPPPDYHHHHHHHHAYYPPPPPPVYYHHHHHHHHHHSGLTILIPGIGVVHSEN